MGFGKDVKILYLKLQQHTKSQIILLGFFADLRILNFPAGLISTLFFFLSPLFCVDAVHVIVQRSRVPNRTAKNHRASERRDEENQPPPNSGSQKRRDRPDEKETAREKCIREEYRGSKGCFSVMTIHLIV